MRKIELYFANRTTITFNCVTDADHNKFLELAKILSKEDSNNTASISYSGTSK